MNEDARKKYLEMYLGCHDDKTPERFYDYIEQINRK